MSQTQGVVLRSEGLIELSFLEGEFNKHPLKNFENVIDRSSKRAKRLTWQ